LRPTQIYGILLAMDQTRVQEDHIHAMAMVKLLLSWRERIASGFGTSHGNAKLELFDVMLVMLAGFFNPMVRSQRLIEALSSQAWMQQQAGASRVPRSTLAGGKTPPRPRPPWRLKGEKRSALQADDGAGRPSCSGECDCPAFRWRGHDALVGSFATMARPIESES
jgi:hypothetical protein